MNFCRYNFTASHFIGDFWKDVQTPMRQSKPLEGFTLFNPATGHYEVPHLIMEMDPVSQCILDFHVDFSDNSSDGKGDEADGSVCSQRP